jgi:hypothetical protein
MTEPCAFLTFLEGACMDPETHDLVLELSSHQAAGTEPPPTLRTRLAARRLQWMRPKPEWS